jgi:hypothetical protein
MHQHMRKRCDRGGKSCAVPPFPNLSVFPGFANNSSHLTGGCSDVGQAALATTPEELDQLNDVKPKNSHAVVLLLDVI